MKSVYAFIQVCGRLDYTTITLRSLGKSEIADQIEMNAIVSPKEAVDVNTVRHVIEDAGLEVGQVLQTSLSPNLSAHQAWSFMYAEATLNRRSWFLWMENDILFNKKWFTPLKISYDTLKNLHADTWFTRKPGLISPNRFDAWQYMATPFDLEGVSKDLKLKDLPMKKLIFKDWMASQCYLCDGDCVLAIDLDREKWGREWGGWDQIIGKGLTARGFVNYCPPKSLVKHIGFFGQGWKGVDKSPSVAFEPDDEAKKFLMSLEGKRCVPESR